MKGRGFFAKDTMIIEIQGSHIRYVINNFDSFGTSKQWILSHYALTKEPLGFEGKARSIILKEILSKGWVRIRQTVGNDAKWTFQFSEFTGCRLALTNFISSAIKSGDIKSYDRIILCGINDRYYKITNIHKVEALFIKED